MYLYKSLFSINKLNQILVSFACFHCVEGLGTCGDSWRYGFVLFVCLFYLQERFMFALVSMSLKVRLVIYI